MHKLYVLCINTRDQIKSLKKNTDRHSGEDLAMFCHQILTTVPKDKNFSCFRDQYSSRGDFTPSGQATNVGGKE